MNAGTFSVRGTGTAGKFGSTGTAEGATEQENGETQTADKD
jgi:hypothetical protein